MSKSADDAVCNYVRNQERHHQRKTFKDELMEFLDKFGVGYDSRYVFD